MFRGIIVMILLLLTALMPAAAQDSWFAYVYNGIEKRLVRVDLDGTTTSYDMGLDENTFANSYDMTFAPDGQRVIFCATTGGQQSRSMLYVRDIAAETNTVELDLGASLGCRTGKEALSPDQSTIAVGVVNYFPGAPNADATMPIWRLLLVDVNSGAIVQELNADMPEAAPINTTDAILPWVKRHEAGRVMFSEVPYATGGAPFFPPFTWDTAANAVTEAPAHFGQMTLKYLPATGEYIWPDVDESRPFTEPIGPMPVANVVQVLDNGEPRPIYYRGEGVITDVAFINQGQQIAILYEPQPDPTVPDAPPMPWVAVDRQGNITDLTQVQTFSQIADAPGGYVLLRMEADENFENIQFSLEHTVIGGETSLLWLAEGQSWELAWAQPVAAAPDLPAFPTAG